jgi:formamidopyrimidine-DNA glycosylase
MTELPEAVTIARQFDERIRGKVISKIAVGNSPHKFAWYYGDQNQYQENGIGQAVESSRALGGFIEVAAGRVRLLFSEGAAPRYHPAGAERPKKHQLLIDFDDGSALSVRVQMYGGLGLVPRDWDDNPYYILARDRPSPLTDGFNQGYFDSLVGSVGEKNPSVKALLATEQRIPGVGNGVLQDILYRAHLHPKKKTNSLADAQLARLFRAIRTTLQEMVDGGGRDTEVDLDGNPGGYKTIMSRLTLGQPCPGCGRPIEKASYMGGTVYFCSACQEL